jgi:hypothetical protein
LESGRHDQQSGLEERPVFPRLAVDNTTGDLMVVYYDTVNDPNRVKTDIWSPPRRPTSPQAMKIAGTSMATTLE